MSIMDIMDDIKHNVDALFADRQIARVVTAYELSQEGYKQPSFERGCFGKANLGRNYVRQANRIARKRNKRYGVYRCPHCDGTHLTTKLDQQDQYAPLLHVTK